MLSYKSQHKKITVRFDEKTICENTAQDCTCGRVYHINEKPNKCYFYKKKPMERSKNVYKGQDNKGIKKIKTLKNNSTDNLDKIKGESYVVKIGGKVIEDFELNEQEFEFHLKVGLSILESNKNRIKTNYANYFNIDTTVLPSIYLLLKDFGILKDLCELFESIAKADFNEVLDEFDEINKQIDGYRESNKLVILDDEAASVRIKKFNRKEVGKKNLEFLNKGKEVVAKPEVRPPRQMLDSQRAMPQHRATFKNYVFMDDFEDTVIEQFYRGQYLFHEFISGEVPKYSNEEDADKFVNLIYRDKNYFYLKKIAVKKKKIKKEVKAIMIDESISAVKKKKKKKAKKKAVQAQKNESDGSVDIGDEILTHNIKAEGSEPSSGLNLIPNIKNYINCGVLEIEKKPEAAKVNPITAVVQVNKQNDVPEVKGQADKVSLEFNNNKKAKKAIESKDEIIQEIRVPSQIEEVIERELCLTHHNKSFSAKPPVRSTKINLSRIAHRKLRDRSEGNIISDDNRRSFTLNSDFNASMDINKRYSDYSNTNNHSLIREMSMEKSNHIIHHKRREKTRKKNNRTIEKKLKNKEMSIERRFNKLTERKSRRQILGDVGDAPDLGIRKNSEDRLTVSDARHEFMERVVDILEVAVDPENDNKIFQVMNRSLQEELEWIREEKNHVVRERESGKSSRGRPAQKNGASLKALNHDQSDDLQMEFLEMLEREKLIQKNEREREQNGNETQNIASVVPEKANKKKKKKKKKTKPVVEQSQDADKKLETPVANVEQINISAKVVKQIPKKKIQESINKKNLAFDINSDTEEKNEFTRMFEILESQTKRGLGPDMDKKLFNVVEGSLNSTREKQTGLRGHETEHSTC